MNFRNAADKGCSPIPRGRICAPRIEQRRPARLSAWTIPCLNRSGIGRFRLKLGVRLPSLRGQPFPKMIELAAGLKVRHGLKVAVVSNEGRDLNAYRIREFKLNSFVDFFVSSCFVHIRKPDAEIFRLALPRSSTTAECTLY